MSENLILGIDGGGTKVVSALSDRAGNIVHVERGGGVNPMDNPSWKQDLEAHLEPFIGNDKIAAVGAALPAYSEVEHLSAAQSSVIKNAFPNAAHRILNDVDAAQIGACAGNPGILILSGTGSMAWARDTAGNSYRAGGWGHIIGDEGSSYWLGRQVLSLASQYFDGRGTAKALAQALLSHLNITKKNAMGGLEGWVEGLHRPRAEVAALSMLLDAVAAQGDQESVQLIQLAAFELSKLYTAISVSTGETKNWTYAGGTFTSQILLDALTQDIGFAPDTPQLHPIGGSLLAARKLLDWPIDEPWLEKTAKATFTATNDASAQKTANVTT